MTTCGVPFGPSGPWDHAWPGGARKIRFRIRKFRKNRKTGKKACDLSNESPWQAGSCGCNKISEFLKNPGKFWENLKNSRNPY